MKLTAKDLQILRNAAAVADAQQELVALQKSRREGRPAGVRAAGPLFTLLFASMVMMYFSVLAITSEREVGPQPVFVSADIPPSPPPG
jgi:hypothetical protein